MTEQKNTFRFIPFLPGIAWFLFVLALICMPGEDLPEEPGWFNIPHLDKIVHAGLFGGLVFWFCLPFRKMMITRPQKINWFIKITIASILWGIATEYIQKFFLTGRQFDLVDWAADSAGAIIAFFLSRKLFLNPKPNTSNLKL
ncbi:MAG TPA: VanZ family protein [Ferruginibacter sp.]|nr:VanZ family protein [Ferruginibacter sp.]